MKPKEKAQTIMDYLLSEIETMNHPEGSLRKIKRIANAFCDIASEERERACKISANFYEKHKRSGEEKRQANNRFYFVQNDIADTCRIIANVIDGHNALSITLNEKSYWEQVKDEINKL